ncbi:hypothetical protein GKQ38_00450 [Candidatus Nanohaloarchaea archaeon]|nr:hypothetical protein GKQ38_00450 [Candidatus Nanohaloarchaea archaeon]
MAGLVIDRESIDLLLQVLKVPLVLLAILLLYRLNRVIEVGEESVESLERTARNVEDSSKTLANFVSIMRKIPFVRGGEDDKRTSGSS